MGYKKPRHTTGDRAYVFCNHSSSKILTLYHSLMHDLGLINPENTGGIVMDFFEVIKQRKSVREYSEKTIEKKLIENIIDAGRLAATARNEQPWEFIVTCDKEILKKICAICPNGPFIKDANCLIAVFSKNTKYYLEDCSASTQNMLLAIEALGLGACWIAGDKKDYIKEFT